jgi:3-oxoacyl-[acyl-carrier protein] reductase
MNPRESARAPLVLPGIQGRTALVTGGSRGIGRAAAVWLARAGAHVGIGYRADSEAASRALSEIRQVTSDREPWAESADLATEEGVSVLFARVDREFNGKLDILVANAGIWNAAPRPLVDMESDEWRAMLDANLTSVYLTTRSAARRMEEGGRIILVSSTAAQRGEAGHSHYAASKGAVQSLVKSVAVELGGQGITVNAVAPGWVDTDMTAVVLRGAERDRVQREIPLGRIASPADVAGPIVFLASDLARHMTGEVLNVNGGSVLCG